MTDLADAEQEAAQPGKTAMLIEDKIVNLAPGMAVTVEIKTGRRRVMEYLL